MEGIICKAGIVEHTSNLGTRRNKLNFARDYTVIAKFYQRAGLNLTFGMKGLLVEEQWQL